MDISLTTLNKLLKDAAERGATIALAKMGHIKPFMNKSEAYRLYGRNNVENWIREGLIHPNKDNVGRNAQIRIDRVEIENVAKSNNIIIR